MADPALEPQVKNPADSSAAGDAPSPVEAQFAPMIVDSSDNTSPSEDDGSSDENELGPADVQSVMGVSIGQAQSHFTNPDTPAAEKVAMMERIEGGGMFESDKLPGSDSRVEDKPPPKDGLVTRRPQKPDQSAPQLRFPSPWRAGPKSFQRTDETRASLRDAFGSHRRRASWGSNAQETIRRMLPSFNLPSLPKGSNLHFSLPSLSYSSSYDIRRDLATGTTRKKSNTVSIPQLDGFGSARINSPPLNTSRNDRNSSAGAGLTRPPAKILENDQLRRSTSRSRPVRSSTPGTRLRRSASDDSLLLYHSLSRASSLGDDSRFEHVQEQVNSRLKAIKDSLQDSNFRFPSMPSMPNMSFATSRLDELSNRSSTLLRDFQGLDAFRSSATRRPTLTRPVPANIQVPRPGPNTTTFNNEIPSSSTHPYLTRALENLTGDLVVMGGYRGSILRSAEFPHRQLWVPFKVGLNLRRVDLEVGLNPEDDENMEKSIIPGGMLSHIGPVDISRRLLKRLRNSRNARKGLLRIHEYSYDWRLNPNLLSRKLQDFLAKLPCNRPGVRAKDRGATVIAHSLGGLITRHAVNHRPELFAGVIYAGTPQHCVNILGPLRNGDDVLLSSRVLTAQVNFTIRTSFALLPLEGHCFIDKYTKEEYPVDFFDPKTWVENCLSPCVSTPLPPLNAPPASGISGLIGSVTNSLSMLSRKGSVSRPHPPKQHSLADSVESMGSREGGPVKAAADLAQPVDAAVEDRGLVPQMSGSQNHHHLSPPAMSSYSTSPISDYHPSTAATSPATACTLPRDAALEYLTRTLAEVKDFKQKLAFRPEHFKANRYPPAAVIYGKSIPTVYGAKVAGREGIRHTDSYDELAFASGDGVVLARAAMIPEGYQAVRDGVVSSDRGHIGLLGDLEAVGRCLTAVAGARRMGVGYGAVQ
jgi:hypothetical protein